MYEELPGWQTELASAHELSELPSAARDFLDLVEREVGVPVRYVGTGPAREHLVQRLP